MGEGFKYSRLLARDLRELQNLGVNSVEQFQVNLLVNQFLQHFHFAQILIQSVMWPSANAAVGQREKSDCFVYLLLYLCL